MKKNPYSHIPHEVQLLRTSYSLIVFGKALLGLEKLTDVHCNMRDLDALNKLVDWHSKACDDIAKFPNIPKKAQNMKMTLAKYEIIAKKNQGRAARAALYIACSLLLLDARITCPAIAKTRAWVYMLKAEQKISDFLIEKFPACDEDEAGTDIYMKLCWNAERQE